MNINLMFTMTDYNSTQASMIILIIHFHTVQRKWKPVDAWNCRQNASTFLKHSNRHVMCNKWSKTRRTSFGPLTSTARHNDARVASVMEMQCMHHILIHRLFMQTYTKTSSLTFCLMPFSLWIHCIRPQFSQLRMLLYPRRVVLYWGCRTGPLETPSISEEKSHSDFSDWYSLI